MLSEQQFKYCISWPSASQNLLMRLFHCRTGNPFLENPPLSSAPFGSDYNGTYMHFLVFSIWRAKQEQQILQIPDRRVISKETHGPTGIYLFSTNLRAEGKQVNSRLQICRETLHNETGFFSETSLNIKHKKQTNPGDPKKQSGVKTWAVLPCYIWYIGEHTKCYIWSFPSLFA